VSGVQRSWGRRWLEPGALCLWLAGCQHLSHCQGRVGLDGGGGVLPWPGGLRRDTLCPGLEDLRGEAGPFLKDLRVCRPSAEGEGPEESSVLWPWVLGSSINFLGLGGDGEYVGLTTLPHPGNEVT
jgi:hypothetical protein